MRLRPREWVWGAVALACAAVFVRLGIWQVRRLEERRGRNAGSAARRALPPILLGRGSVITLDSVQNRRVLARGTYDYSAERLWTGRTYEGTPGVAVLTLLRLADRVGGGGSGAEWPRRSMWTAAGYRPPTAYTLTSWRCGKGTPRPSRAWPSRRQEPEGT